MAFIGRLHLLLIHFPIALVIAAVAAEGAAAVTADDKWHMVAVRNVRAGAVFAVLAAIAGWRLSLEMGMDASPLLEWHRWLGTIGGVRDIRGRDRDGRRGQPFAARSTELQDRVVRRGSTGRRCRTSRRTAGVGRELPAPMREARVARTDDERDLDRRNFLKCMAWVGTGAVWTLSSGILKGSPLGEPPRASMMPMSHGDGALRFVQISDSHIGFNKPANTDVTATLRAAISKIKAAPEPPAFVLHTGDLTHLSKPAEFDTLQQVLSELSVPVFYVPGEHDVLEDDGRSYLQRFGKGTHGAGWHSFDHGGVHFIGLVNVVNLKAGGLGLLGAEQLEWLEKDVKQPQEQHAHRRLCAHPAVVGVPRVGMGDGRQRTRAVVSQAVWFRLGPERSHSSGDAEGRRPRDVSYGDVDCLSAARAGCGRVAGPDEGGR